MAIYRNMSMSFWTDTKVTDDFTPEDRYFYLYILTNPHTNLSGCYEISMKQMSDETGYNNDTIKRLIDRFSNIHNVIRYSAETKEVLILNWYRYNWTKSPKLNKPLLKYIEAIKNIEFQKYVGGLYNGREPEIPYRYHIDTTVTVSVTDTDTDSISNTITEEEKPKRKRFEPPTLEEVEAYCFERKNRVDAERFVDYYTSNGWQVGKTKMKDWKAAVRTWEKNGFANNQNRQPSGGNVFLEMAKDEGIF